MFVFFPSKWFSFGDPVIVHFAHTLYFNCFYNGQNNLVVILSIKKNYFAPKLRTNKIEKLRLCQ